MEKYLQFKHGANIFGLREKIQEQTLPSRSPSFSFVMIVLNGMPLIEYSLRSIYDFAHEIIIVEGAVENCMSAANPDGGSTDGTVEFIKSFPDPHRKIRLIQGRWPEKCEMQNEALKYITGDYVWLIDSDEVYKKEDLEKIRQILAHDPSITQVNFIPDSFWKGLDDIVVSAKFFEPANHYRRLFKYVPNARFTSHRPPTMVWPGSDKTTEQMHLLDGLQTRQMGIIFYHYNYISEKQVAQKNDYYANLDKQANRWGIDRRDWFQNCFLKWNPADRSRIESKFPVWLGDKASHTHPFSGTHPQVMIDYAREYDRAGRTYPSPPVMQNLIDTVNDLKRTFPDERLEVIETGTIRTFHAAGSSTFCISRDLGPRGRLTSIDISPDSIRISKNFCHDASNIEWVESDSVAYLSTLKDKKFHLAFLDSVNDKNVIFREFRLIVPLMVPNGIVIIDDAGITADGSSIDGNVAAQKGHEVWRFLKACRAELDILPTPNFRSTQLKVPLTESNLQLIKENISRFDADSTVSAALQKTPKAGGSVCSVSDTTPLSAAPSEQNPQECRDFRLPWTRPINKDKWKSFLSHDFENASRKAVFEVLEKYLEESDRPCRLDFVEVGFGQAYDFARFLKRFHDEGSIKYVGYDITDQFVEYAKQEYPGYDFRKGGFMSLEKKSFDISYTRHTFEHLSPDLYEACLRSLLDATRRICIITWFVRPAGNIRFHWSQSDGFEHTGAYVNTYAKSSILNIIDEVGFDAEIIKPESNDEIYLLKRRKRSTRGSSVTTPTEKPTIHFAYSGDPFNDNAIRAPGTITNKLFRFLQERANVKYYDWADKTTAANVAPEDIVLGHPNPQPDTIMRRLFEKKCAGKYLIWPFHTGIPEINRYARDLAEIADKLFLVCGPYWTETIDQTEYASWKQKIVRLDNAVDAKVFPLLKRNFNPSGKRGMFVFGRSGPEKGTTQLFELLLKVRRPAVIAGDYSPDDLRIIKDRPQTHVLGKIDWRNRQTATFIINSCDFFVNMSVSDASPTTLLESMALGLIPITTPQCGYCYDSFLLLSLSLEDLNLQVLEDAQRLSENELKELQAKNRSIIEREHTWEKFCQTVWQNIKPSAGDAVVVSAQQQPSEYISRQVQTFQKGKKVLIVRSDSIGDFVIFGGAIPCYKKLYPGAHLAMVVSEPVAPLADTCPYIDEIITFNRRRICCEPDYAAQFASCVRDRKFDVVICPALSRDKVSEFIALNSGAPQKITCSGDTANLPADIIQANNAHYTKIVPMAEGIALETFRSEEFLRGLGLELHGPCRPAVWITTEDRQFAENLLSRRGIKDPIVIVPFAQLQLDIRNWPLHNWVRLISMYRETPVIICGIENDKAAAEQIAKVSSHPNVHNFCGLTTVRQFAALISKGRVCISSDSAAAHFAAVANRPHVVLVGGGHFGRFVPYSSQTHLVYNKMDCYNCNWKCKYDRDIRCINSISVDQVRLAVDRALGTTEPQPAGFVTRANPQTNRDSAGRREYLVSAIVSAYNSQQYIRGCLEDIENQTIADRLEIIVVNSGSQQNEAAIVKEFQQKYENIEYIETKDRETVYAAWNRAIRIARGKYLTNANTDDRHRRDALEIMALALEDNPDRTLVYANCSIIDDATGQRVDQTARGPFSAARLLDHCFIGPQPMWRKNLHDEFGYFDESFFSAGDYEFWLRIAQKYSFLYLDEVLGQYRKRGDSIERCSGGTVGRFETAVIQKAYRYAQLSSIAVDRHGITRNPQFRNWCEINLIEKRAAELLTGRTLETDSRVCDFRSDDTSPLLSVIIVAYNRNSELLAGLKSFARQSERNFEVVIVNNGQPVPELAEKHHMFPFGLCYIELAKNFGPSLARNVGARYAKAPHIAFIDDDATADDIFVQNIIQHFRNHNVAGLRGKILPKDGHYKPDHYDLGRDIIHFAADVEGNCAFRKDVFFSVGGFDEYLFHNEGFDLSFRIFKQENEKLESILYFPDVVVYHNPPTRELNIEKTLRADSIGSLIVAKDPAIKEYMDFLFNFYPSNRDNIENKYGRLVNNALFLQKNYPREALKWSLKAHAANPGGIKACYVLGGIYIILEEYDKARVALEKIREPLRNALAGAASVPVCPEFEARSDIAECYLSLCTQLARCYIKRGECDRVKAIYADLLSNPDLTIPPGQKTAIEKVLAKLGQAPQSSFARLETAEACHPCESGHGYLVSAIVSAYNSEKFLPGCLDDLEQQTIADKLEIIVVNSGSQQNEAAIVKEFQQKYENIEYIETKDRETIYAAWNRAVRIARGKYLTNANTDDRHRPDALEIMAAVLETSPDIALVYGDQIRTDTPNETFANHHATELLRKPEYSPQRLLFGCCAGSQPMWRKSLHDDFGYFDETLTCAADWDFWLRVSARYDFKHISEFLGLYYYNKEGIEHGRKIHSLYERYIVGKRYGTPYISVIALHQAPGNPLLSVVMPAHNAAAHIADAIESVLIQNYRNFELIIVDDGSTDSTADIVQSFSDDKVRYFHKEKAGAAAARNLAIQNARGDFIIPLDCDDMMTPDFIAQHLRCFEEHPDADLVYCDDCLIDETGRPLRVIERREYTDTGRLISDLFRTGFPVVPFRTCIRKSVFDKVGLYDETLTVAEDYDMLRRFIKLGLKAQHLKAALYLRRLTPDSLSRTYSARNAQSHFEVVSRYAESFDYDQLFPDVEWDKISPELRALHARCRAALTYLAIGQAYVRSNAPSYVETAFDLACSQLDQCLRIDPENPRIQQLLHKCRSVRAAFSQGPQQPARAVT